MTVCVVSKGQPGIDGSMLYATTVSTTDYELYIQEEDKSIPAHINNLVLI